jgi:class 3 adenylate cyclase
MRFDVSKFLEKVGSNAEADLKESVSIIDATTFPKDKDEIGQGRSWLKIEDVVAVVADLKNSTAISLRKHPKTTAQLYEAVTGGSVEIVSKFEPDFVDIQGDGLFALYHGEQAFERALCAGISLKTFSAKHLVPAIDRWQNKGNDFPKQTGLKVGMNAGTLAVKKIGIKSRNVEWTEPVWAGRPVNWAFKCAQSADAQELIATESVFKKFENNDYVTHSCAHDGSTPDRLWSPATVEPLGRYAVRTMKLRTGWCDQCGTAFCQAILDGKTKRSDVTVSGIA